MHFCAIFNGNFIFCNIFSVSTDIDCEVSKRLSIIGEEYYWPRCFYTGGSAITVEFYRSLSEIFHKARDRINKNAIQKTHVRRMHSRGRRQYNGRTTSEIAALIDGK